VKRKAPKVRQNETQAKQAEAKRTQAKQPEPTAEPRMKQKNLFLFSAVFLLIAFIVGTLIYKSEKSDAAAEAYRRDKSTYVRDHSPAFGNVASKVEIVEFFDPACETCREFYPLVKKMMAANPDRIRLYARYAPFHKGSDHVVKILAAANKQGKFWETLDAVFAAQPTWAANHQPQPELVWNYIGGLGLNIDKLRQDMNSPEIETLIAQDLADAKKLNVTMTPEFFVNGKPLPSFGIEQLKDLVVDALDSAYR